MVAGVSGSKKREVGGTSGGGRVLGEVRRGMPDTPPTCVTNLYRADHPVNLSTSTAHHAFPNTESHLDKKALFLSLFFLGQ